MGNQHRKSFLYNEKAEPFKKIFNKLILQIGTKSQVLVDTKIHFNVHKMLFDENKISIEQAMKLLNAYKRINK